LQTKFHKAADGSERSSQSENGDVKMSSHKPHSRRLSSQRSVSQDGSTSSVKDHEHDLDDPKPTNHKRATRSSRDFSHSGATDNKLTVGKSRGRHKSVDVQRSKMGSGPSFDLEPADESRAKDTETRAATAENSGLLSVSTISADAAAMTRSHQDLASNYMRFSPRPSSSRLSSHVDLRGFDAAPNRRTTSAVSASTSVGSGLDDDDYIDPHRDVGIAVCIRDGYFSWLPQANGEALMSDINFVADAGQYIKSALIYSL